jgi:hypothetical protein
MHGFANFKFLVEWVKTPSRFIFCAGHENAITTLFDTHRRRLLQYHIWRYMSSIFVTATFYMANKLVVYKVKATKVLIKYPVLLRKLSVNINYAPFVAFRWSV